MAFNVDTSGAPALVRLEIRGQFPTEEQEALRNDLMARGLLTEARVTLKPVPWMSTAAFINEREAIEWLLNPEGRAAVPR